MRVLRFTLALCMLSGCGEDEEERNAPPIGSGGGGSSPSGGGSAANGTDSGPSSGSSGLDQTSGGPLTMTGGPATTTGAPFAVLSGRFTDGGGAYALPIQCAVQFHQPGEINPSSGVDTATTFRRPIVIDAFPQSFTIMSDDIGNVVMTGDPGYVTSECDVDGDNFFDDNAGAFFPGLPLTEISIPASSIDLAVGPI